MESINNISYESLCRYFKHLSLFGYEKEESVNKLLLLLFLRKILQDYVVSEKDYRKIMCIISCLQDSTCLIPYNTDLSYDNYITNNDNEEVNDYKSNVTVRISEDDIIRISLNNKFRIKE